MLISLKHIPVYSKTREKHCFEVVSSFFNGCRLVFDDYNSHNALPALHYHLRCCTFGKRIQMITGTAMAILPTSASFCIIFLTRFWERKQQISLQHHSFRQVMVLRSGAPRNHVDRGAKAVD